MPSLADSETVWRPVEDQLEAYNARDLEAFLRPYADDVKILAQPGGRVLHQSTLTMRAEYRALFDRNPDLHCDVRSRIVSGEYVFDQEHVRIGTNAVEIVAVYRVTSGRIVEVWFFPPHAV